MTEISPPCMAAPACDRTKMPDAAPPLAARLFSLPVPGSLVREPGQGIARTAHGSPGSLVPSDITAAISQCLAQDNGVVKRWLLS